MPIRVAEAAQTREWRSPKSLDLNENVKHLHTLLCCDIKICRDFRVLKSLASKNVKTIIPCICNFVLLRLWLYAQKQYFSREFTANKRPFKELKASFAFAESGQLLPP